MKLIVKYGEKNTEITKEDGTVLTVWNNDVVKNKNIPDILKKIYKGIEVEEIKP